MMALTRTPRSATCAENATVSPMTPVLLALYAGDMLVRPTRETCARAPKVLKAAGLRKAGASCDPRPSRTILGEAPRGGDGMALDDALAGSLVYARLITNVIA